MEIIATLYIVTLFFMSFFVFINYLRNNRNNTERVLVNFNNTEICNKKEEKESFYIFYRFGYWTPFGEWEFIDPIEKKYFRTKEEAEKYYQENKDKIKLPTGGSRRYSDVEWVKSWE